MLPATLLRARPPALTPFAARSENLLTASSTPSWRRCRPARGRAGRGNLLGTSPSARLHLCASRGHPPQFVHPSSRGFTTTAGAATPFRPPRNDPHEDFSIDARPPFRPAARAETPVHVRSRRWPPSARFRRSVGRLAGRSPGRGPLENYPRNGAVTRSGTRPQPYGGERLGRRRLLLGAHLPMNERATPP